MKVPFSYLRGAVRFSLSRESTAEDIDCVAEALPEIVYELAKPLPEATTPDLYHGVYA
jgi:cysteine sulfinate desulfinase/cysteine desulfurase-like protein